VRTAVRSPAIVLTGVFTGFLIAVLVIETTLRGYDAHVYTQVRLIELAHLDTLASVTLLPALVLTAVDAFWARHDRLRTLVWVALALLLAVLTVSASVNLPINQDQAGWNIATPPADWASIRDRWQTAHAARTVAAIVAFTLLAIRSVRRRPAL